MDLLLQGRVLLLDGVEHPGDRAHLGVGAGGDDDGAARPLGHGGAPVDHAGAVGQVGVRADGPGGLDDGVGLTGQGGLHHAQGSGRDQAGIGTDLVALAQDEDVAHHELGGGDDQPRAVAQHRGGRLGHGGQGGDGVSGLVLLDEPEDGVEGHDGDDDDGVHRHALGALQDPGDGGDDDGGQQEVDERVVELAQEAQPGGCRRLGGQLVGAVGGQAVGRGLRAQAAGGVGTEVGGDGVGRAGVGGLGCCGGRGGAGRLGRCVHGGCFGHGRYPISGGGPSQVSGSVIWANRMGSSSLVRRLRRYQCDRWRAAASGSFSSTRLPSLHGQTTRVRGRNTRGGTGLPVPPRVEGPRPMGGDASGASVGRRQSQASEGWRPSVPTRCSR